MAARPSITGICMSINTRSKLLVSKAASAAALLVDDLRQRDADRSEDELDDPPVDLVVLGQQHAQTLRTFRNLHRERLHGPGLGRQRALQRNDGGEVVRLLRLGRAASILPPIISTSAWQIERHLRDLCCRSGG